MLEAEQKNKIDNCIHEFQELKQMYKELKHENVIDIYLLNAYTIYDIVNYIQGGAKTTEKEFKEIDAELQKVLLAEATVTLLNKLTMHQIFNILLKRQFSIFSNVKSSILIHSVIRYIVNSNEKLHIEHVKKQILKEMEAV